MAVELLLVSFLIASLSLTGTGNVGVDYGRDGDNLPSPGEVVALYQSQGIGKMRIYEPFQDVLQALRGSNIEVMMGVPNRDLQRLAEDNSAAINWVQTNVLNYRPSVNIRYIAVGNEVTPVNQNSGYAPFVVRAMTNVFNAIKDAGLFQTILVSTSIDTGVIEESTSYPPSAARFRDDVLGFMNPVLGFLSDTGGPILLSVYPYFARSDPRISLPYALFTKTSPEFTDPGNNLQYFNLFDAELDGVYAAMEKNLGTSSNSMLEDPYLSPQKANRPVPRPVVTETGWPKAGNRPPSRRLLGTDETIDNACTYYQNVIRHVKNGTPRMSGVPIDTYLFAMFDENLKQGADSERNFGLFYTNKAPVCQINFRE
ncbi:putative glucan endo-1 [Ranunculus cassubicifolius]